MANISGVIKSIRDIMWQDSGLNGDAQRIEQLGWMLFLKIFSDKDRELELLSDSYKSPIPPMFHWIKEKGNWAGDDEGMTGDELLAFVDQKLFPAMRNLDLSIGNGRALIVREVFTGNNNYMKSGINIRKVLNKLNELDFNIAKERHAFGELYEGILKDLQSAGKSGEFYTPRAITNFITDIISPKLGERILDPSCGTGGYLTSAIEHLMSQANSVEERQSIQENVMGWEYKPLPYLLAITNLILHDIELPKISFRDSLDQPLSNYKERERVDVILANPPFGGIVANNNEKNFPQNFRTKESADLFLVLMIHLLKIGGRAGIVLPDGSLTGEGVKQRVREKLLTECNLHTIVRLPNSVFKPYAIVPTNLLFFEKGNVTKEVWYYEHLLPQGQKSYSKTKPIRLEDFYQLKQWWSKREENDVAWKVSLKTIQERNFDLDIKNPYKKSKEYIDFEIAVSNNENSQVAVTEKLEEIRKEFLSLKCSNDFQKLLNHLELVTTVEEGISKLKSTLIGLAMQGRLTEQLPTDGNANDLLEKIKVSKTLYGKRERTSIPIDHEQIKSKIPDNWVWCKLGDIITMNYGDSLTKADCILNGIYPVFGSNGIVGYYNKFLTEKKTIIIGRKGSAGAINRCNVPSWTTDVAYYVEEDENLDFDFLFYLLKSIRLDKIGKGIKPGINRNNAYNILLCLPPSLEQIRIVKKLEQMINLCDELEQVVKQKQECKRDLLQVALKEALEPNN